MSRARRSSSARSRSLRVRAAARSNSSRASAAQSSFIERIASHRRQQVIALQPAFRDQPIDDREGGLRTEGHRDRDSAIEPSTGDGEKTGEDGVERGDVSPVGVGGGRRRGMCRGDGRLQRVPQAPPPSCSARPSASRPRAIRMPIPSARGSDPSAGSGRRTRSRAREIATPGARAAPRGRGSSDSSGINPLEHRVRGAARLRRGRGASSRCRRSRCSLR